MRQLIKFCLVGASSTVISLGISALLLNTFPALAWYFSQTIAFCFGVTNGFIWNRLWTFKAQNLGSPKQQYPKFVFTNVIGLVLNLMITKGFLVLFTGQILHQQNPDTRTALLAQMCAIPIVVIWNFTAARFWTFRAPKTENSSSTKAPPVAAP